MGKMRKMRKMGKMGKRVVLPLLPLLPLLLYFPCSSLPPTPAPGVARLAGQT
jgi:hypothetical protein